MYSLGPSPSTSNCYKFFLDEQDRRPWPDARSYCNDRFSATNLAIQRQVLETLNISQFIIIIRNDKW